MSNEVCLPHLMVEEDEVDEPSSEAAVVPPVRPSGPPPLAEVEVEPEPSEA